MTLVCPRCAKDARPVSTESARQTYECQRLHRFAIVDGVICPDEDRFEKRRVSHRKVKTRNAHE
jgi:hypothetical protein